MLACLFNINSFVSDAYKDNTYDMICQIHHSNMEKFFIQQQHDLNLRHLC